MLYTVIGFLAITLCTSPISAMAGQPELTIESIDVTNVDNSLGEWKGSVKDGKKVSISMPIFGSLEDWTVHMHVEVDGEEMSDVEKSVCECINDETIGKDVQKVGQPKGEFPEDCPIGEGDFEVVDYAFDEEKLRGFPDGNMEVLIEFIKPSGDVSKKLFVKANIKN